MSGPAPTGDPVTKSSRFKLIALGVLAALLSLALVAYSPLTVEEAEPILKWLAGLLGIGVAGYSYRDHSKDPS